MRFRWTLGRRARSPLTGWAALCLVVYSVGTQGCRGRTRCSGCRCYGKRGVAIIARKNGWVLIRARRTKAKAAYSSFVQDGFEFIRSRGDGTNRISPLNNIINNPIVSTILCKGSGRKIFDHPKRVVSSIKQSKCQRCVGNISCCCPRNRHRISYFVRLTSVWGNHP